MSLCPFAERKLLPESHTQPVIAPRIAILHSAAGRGSLYRFFRDSSNLESHFWVSESGVIEQYVDTNRRADANRNANGYAVSIETESSVAATERWAPAQSAAIVRLLDWLCTEHPNIKRQQCPKPDGAGIGWHIMFGAPGPWTPVAKSCPGPRRIEQARNEIIPAVIAKTGRPAWVPPRFRGTVRPGDRSERVREWALLLSTIGYGGFIPTGGSGAVMGVGKVRATKKFQRDRGLVVDGIVGPKTHAEAVTVLRAQRRRKGLPT